MPKNDIDKMSVKELQSLIGRAEKLIDKKRKQEERAFIKEMKAKAKERGLNLNEILEVPAVKMGGGPKKKRAPAKPKYCNPNNPEQTWTGKGRAPAWAKPYKDKNKLDDILIAG